MGACLQCVALPIWQARGGRAPICKGGRTSGLIAKTTPHPAGQMPIWPPLSVVPKTFPVESTATRLSKGNPPSLPPVKRWRMLSVHVPSVFGVSLKTTPGPWGTPPPAAAEIGRTVEVARGVDRETVLGVRSVGTDGAAHGERVDDNDGLRYAPAWQIPRLWLEPGRS